jgi:hypothetical protein
MEFAIRKFGVCQGSISPTCLFKEHLLPLKTERCDKVSSQPGIPDIQFEILEFTARPRKSGFDPGPVVSP